METNVIPFRHNIYRDGLLIANVKTMFIRFERCNDNVIKLIDARFDNVVAAIYFKYGGYGDYERTYVLQELYNDTLQAGIHNHKRFHNQEINISFMGESFYNFSIGILCNEK